MEGSESSKTAVEITITDPNDSGVEIGVDEFDEGRFSIIDVKDVEVDENLEYVVEYDYQRRLSTIHEAEDSGKDSDVYELVETVECHTTDESDSSGEEYYHSPRSVRSISPQNPGSPSPGSRNTLGVEMYDTLTGILDRIMLTEGNFGYKDYKLSLPPLLTLGDTSSDDELDVSGSNIPTVFKQKMKQLRIERQKDPIDRNKEYHRLSSNNTSSDCDSEFEEDDDFCKIENDEDTLSSSNNIIGSEAEAEEAVNVNEDEKMTDTEIVEYNLDKEREDFDALPLKIRHATLFSNTMRDFRLKRLSTNNTSILFPEQRGKCKVSSPKVNVEFVNLTPAPLNDYQCFIPTEEEVFELETIEEVLTEIIEEDFAVGLKMNPFTLNACPCGDEYRKIQRLNEKCIF